MVWGERRGTPRPVLAVGEGALPAFAWPFRRRSRSADRSAEAASPPVPAPNELLRQEMLGTEAVYRVVRHNERGVEVEVVQAPGLEPGARFTIRIEDALKMRSSGQ